MTRESKGSKPKAPPKDFGFGEDESLLFEMAGKFLDEQLPVETLRTLVARDPETVYEQGQRAEWDEGLWKQIVELGWSGLAVPEENGGVGFSLVGIAGLVEQVGRHALPSPLVATLIATLALRESELENAATWMSRIAEGASASLATTPSTAEVGMPNRARFSQQKRRGAFILDGTACFVQDAFKADHFVVQARHGNTSVLCVVPSDAAGLTLEQNHIHDLTRDQATLRLEGVRVDNEALVSRDAEATLRTAWPAVLVAVSADLCGTGEWLLQTTVEYAKNRKQFDRAIGFFQAVKHPLVNGMIGVDRARSLLYNAACAIDVGAPEAEQAARMAKSAASDAGAFLSDRAVQLHGGIGFTWESDVHLFFKRSMHDQALYGDGVHQRKKLADMLIGEIGQTAAGT